MSHADSLPLLLRETAESRVAGAPDHAFEDWLVRSGKPLVAGIDEAGRGPLAGPVVAAAVILDPSAIPAGLNDSKLLGKARRERLFEEIIASCDVAWCSVCALRIDRINILAATLEAMTAAFRALPRRADACLIDGRDVPPPLHGLGHAVIKGDSRSLSIAAASIVAKVARDRMMEQADADFPGYGFARHAGYGTRAHREALEALGPCVLHRRSYAPVREVLSRAIRA